MHLFSVLILEGLEILHRTIQFQLLWGIDLDYCNIERFALEMNRDHSVVFETAPEFCIVDFWLTMMATSFLLKDSWPQ